MRWAMGDKVPTSPISLVKQSSQMELVKLVKDVPKVSLSPNVSTSPMFPKGCPIKIIRRHSMMITVRSKIEKGSIRLPKKVRLQDGTPVIVRIEPILKTKEKLKTIAELSGAWSNDPTIMPIFEELEQERHRNIGREVSFE